MNVSDGGWGKLYRLRGLRMRATVIIDKVLKESMHGDSKETFGGNVPSERYYVIAAIARNIQFPGGNDSGAPSAALRRTGSAQFQSSLVALFQDAPGAVSRRSVQDENSRAAALANLIRPAYR